MLITYKLTIFGVDITREYRIYRDDVSRRDGIITAEQDVRQLSEWPLVARHKTVSRGIPVWGSMSTNVDHVEYLQT